MPRRAGLALAGAVFLLPLLLNNLPFWRHVLVVPGGLDLRSLAVLARHGALPLLAGGALALAFLAVGSAVLRLLRLGEDGVHPAFAFSLGMGVVGAAVFFMGLAGLLGPVSLRLLALACGGLAVWTVRAAFTSHPLPAKSFPAPRNLLEWLMLGILACSAWHTLILALAPATEWDVILYHLSLPKLYLGLGRITEIPWFLYSHWPHLMEALYALPLGLGDDAVPALIHLAACWTLAAAVYRAGTEEFGRPSGLAAACLVASQPVFLRIAGTAHSDGAFALFHFLGCWALWRWRSGRGPRWLIAAGLLAGLAASTKLIAVSLLAANALLIWLSPLPDQGAKGGRPRSGLASAGLYAGLGLAVVLPWYVKTAVGTGNPFWPMFSGVLGGRWGAEVLEAAYVHSSQWPWPLEAGRLLRWGPQALLVPCLVLWLLAVRQEKTPAFLKSLLLPLVLYLPLVIRYEDAWRYLLPFFPAFALTAAWAASRLTEGRFPLKAAAYGMLLFGLAPALAATQNNQLFAVFGAVSRLEPGRASREVYLERTLDHYRPFRALSSVLPLRARVLFVREARGYYFEGDYQWGDPLNQGLVDYALMPGPAALAARLREMGITHVLVNEVLASDQGALRSYDPRVMALIRSLLGRCPRVFRQGPIVVYQL
ncbi:MAG: glycosyltransferase family 39 protein [Elusimicrobiota bacterium]